MNITFYLMAQAILFRMRSTCYMKHAARRWLSIALRSPALNNNNMETI